MEKTFMELEKNSPLHRRPKALHFQDRELLSGFKDDLITASLRYVGKSLEFSRHSLLGYNTIYSDG
jgi:hypothetical protein